MDTQQDTTSVSPVAGSKKSSMLMSFASLTMYFTLMISLWQVVIYLGTHYCSFYHLSLLTQFNTFDQFLQSTHFAMAREFDVSHIMARACLTNGDSSGRVLEQKLSQGEQQLDDYARMKETQKALLDENYVNESSEKELDVNVKEELLKAIDLVQNRFRSLERRSSADWEAKMGGHNSISRLWQKLRAINSR